MKRSAPERWEVIPEAPAYQVSSLGRVRRHVAGKRGAKPGIIKPWVDKIGRPTVRLWSDGRQMTLKICRLVCVAFNGPPPRPGLIVAHWDDCPDNNTPVNLRWTTHKGNTDDRRRLGSIPVGEEASNAKLTEDQVRHIRATQGATHALAAELGVHPETVRRARNGEAWGHVS